MWSSAPGVTANDAVPVFDASVAVTVWAPAFVAVQVAPVHEPFGAIARLDAAVTSPRELSYWSRPSTVYVREPPAEIELADGERTRWSSGPAAPARPPPPASPPLVAVIVWTPAAVAVHDEAVHEPFGAIVKVVVV